MRLLSLSAATAAALAGWSPLANGTEIPMQAAAARGELDEVVIFARGENLIGLADAASEGAVGGADLSVRPLLRVAELLEAVPGVIAAQHSGTGKANQYFLRGFNLDHGTDFTTYIDDVPMNLRTHGHGQGYLDLNGLIPEMADRVDYRKGPYRADVGDFALAGAAFISTIDRLEAPFLAFESGQYDWLRLAAGTTLDVGHGELTLLGQWKAYDGPWALEEHLRHESVWSKYTRTTSLGELQATLSGYHAEWRPTEQIPERAIGTPVCADEFCALDTTATGETVRWVASVRLLGERWRSTLYAQHYDWHMLSDPTYDFQINQLDRRNVFGGRFERQLLRGERLTVDIGTEARYDDVSRVGLQHTIAGVFNASLGRYAVREGSVSPYAEASWRPIERLRLMTGLRADFYSFDVASRQAGYPGGDTSADIFSPKLGAAYAWNDRVELYANWGRGFHSNDARGVAAPLPGNDPVAGLVRGTGQELGARFQLGRFTLTTTCWWLEVGSELKFVGDSNSVEPSAPSRRRGYELVGFWRPFEWLAIDGVWTESRARSSDSPGAEYLPGAVENAGELGVSAVQDRWEASLRVRHLGPYPLIEDNSLRAASQTTVNLRAAWKASHLTLYAELLNALDDDGKDIVYYYPAHVEGLDPPGVQVDGRMSRAVEPRTVRAGLKYEF